MRHDACCAVDTLPTLQLLPRPHRPASLPAATTVASQPAAAKSTPVTAAAEPAAARATAAALATPAAAVAAIAKARAASRLLQQTVHHRY